MRPSQTSRHRRLPDPHLSRRVLSGLGLVIAVVLVAAASASASAAGKPRATVIGDSISASFDYVPAARHRLGRGLDLRSDAMVCRRLVAASCVFQGSTPTTALGVIGARGQSLGSVVVINVGYNDWAAVYDVDRVMRALKAAGVTTAIWVTLRQTTSNYAQSNARIRSAARRWRKTLVVADWNAFSHGKPWFREDGLHLTPTGAMALARLLRPLVLAGTDASQRPVSAVPTVLHSRVEPLTKFPLAAHVSGWTTSRDLSTGRPRAGITSERMFCSPCTRGVVPSRFGPIGRGRAGRLDCRIVRNVRLRLPHAPRAPRACAARLPVIVP